jgi:hypothetical protein
MGFSWIEAAIVAAIVLILVAVGWGAYSESQRPTIEIKKDDWECVKSEQRTHLQPMGKVLMPMITTVCVEYRRHAG